MKRILNALILIAAVLAAGQLHAAIAVDATSSCTGTGSDATCTASHTTGTLTNGIMIILVTWDAAGTYDPTVASITVGGSSTGVTQVSGARQSLVSGWSGGRFGMDVWYLKAPSSGATNVVVTLDSGSAKIGVGVITFSGVDQTTPFGTAVLSGGASTADPVTSSAVSNNAGDYTVGAALCSGCYGFGTSNTEIFSVTVSGVGRSAAYSSTEDVAMAWTVGGTANGWLTSAVPVLQASAGASITRTLRVSQGG